MYNDVIPYINVPYLYSLLLFAGRNISKKVQAQQLNQQRLITENICNIFVPYTKSWNDIMHWCTYW